MSEPINIDRQIFGYFHSGVGLAASFADEYAKYYGEEIGLIPCAEGNTSVSEWQPGEILFENAVVQAKLAQRTSEIAGILWHQGENDSINPEDSKKYHDRFLNVITTLKKELSLPCDIPVVIGELGEFVGTFADGRCCNYKEVNNVLKTLSDELPYVALAIAAGLSCRSDGIHFDSASYRIFGKRYFESYLSLKNNLRRLAE